jgi:hypothetical protein
MDGASGSPTPDIDGQALGHRIVSLLRSLTTTWQPLDYRGMPAADHYALVLLTEAGLIEWKVRVRLFLRDYPNEVYFEGQVTGERCFEKIVWHIDGLAKRTDGGWLRATSTPCRVFPYPLKEAPLPPNLIDTYVGWRLPMDAQLTTRFEQVQAAANEDSYEPVVDYVLRRGAHAGRDRVPPQYWMTQFEHRRASPAPCPPGDEGTWYEEITTVREAHKLAGSLPGVEVLTPTPSLSEEELPLIAAAPTRGLPTVPAAQRGDDAVAVDGDAAVAAQRPAGGGKATGTPRSEVDLDAEALRQTPEYWRTVGFMTEGASDDRALDITRIVRSDLTVNQKLEAINKIMPFTKTSREWAKELGCSPQAVTKTDWWKKHKRQQDCEAEERKAELRDKGKRLY